MIPYFFSLDLCINHHTIDLYYLFLAFNIFLFFLRKRRLFFCYLIHFMLYIFFLILSFIIYICFRLLILLIMKTKHLLSFSLFLFLTFGIFFLSQNFKKICYYGRNRDYFLNFNTCRYLSAVRGRRNSFW